MFKYENIAYGSYFIAAKAYTKRRTKIIAVLIFLSVLFDVKLLVQQADACRTDISTR